ncbi:hypothetical protein [Nocardia tengchongensis]|uniref:hypothetical protein n=1 Tax=Nocardia tengchongensis TaxID=2055889 RepID=UPI003668ECE2
MAGEQSLQLGSSSRFLGPLRISDHLHPVANLLVLLLEVSMITTARFALNRVYHAESGGAVATSVIFGGPACLRSAMRGCGL